MSITMETEEHHDVFFLSRDELKEANCCRFCGYGVRKESIEEEEFTRMYEKLVVEGDDGMNMVTLDVVINKYLPISVSSQELYYPQVICSSCTESLHLTVEFFQKIAKGQKLLANIINEMYMPKLQDKIDGDPAPLVFSGENPILLAPKRRGRPRRDPNTPKVSKAEVPIASYYLESKPKRQIRRPVRYDPMSSDIVTDIVIKEEVEDVIEPSDSNSSFPFLNEENLEPSTSIGASSLKTCSTNLEGLKHSSNLIMQNVSSEFTSLTRTENLMDLSKLNVIMDGDEEIESSNLESTTSNSQRLDPPGLMEVNKNPGSVECNNMESQVDDIVCLSAAPVSRSVDNDSDASVKTIDFFVKKKVKRGQKKTKRKITTKKIECEICKKAFSHTNSLIYHRNAAHAEVKKFGCTVCNKAFTHKQLLLNHSYVHSDEKFFKCNLCPAKFKSKASLYTHNKSIHTTDNAHTCDHCGSRFNLKSSLKAHIRLHTGEKPYSCEFCNKKFSQKSNYKEHRRIHTGERPYKCDFENCDKAFTTASQLRSHKMTHTDSKRFLCSICGRGFTHSENFKYHMRRHNGEKPLECVICMKQFTEPWALKKHGRMHTGEKPYSCEICKKEFSDSSNFTKHKKSHESDEVAQDVSNHIPTNQVSLSPIDKNEAGASGAVSELMEEVAEQIIEDSAPNDEFVEELNAENLDSSLVDVQDDQQVLLLYPHDDMQYYTIIVSNNQGTAEAQTSEGMQTVAFLDPEFAQLYNIENVTDTSTIPEGEETTPMEVSNGDDIIKEEINEMEKSKLATE